MATEEQVEAPAYKPSPFMKAAAQIIEASEGHVPDDLHWDPLTMSYGGGAGLPSDAIELPTELMMNLVGPGLAAVRNVKPTPEVPLAPSQERARKRLQQRKEAAAREAAEKAAQQEKEVEEPLDESWIDQLEQKDAKKKAGREKAVQIRKERKKARKADAAAKLEALESAEAQEEVEEVAEPEPVQQETVEEIEDEDDMQPVEQSKQRRKRQARQAAKQREEAEQARREEERREEEARLEAERKQREAEKARLEQERLEQERKRLEEQREAERKEEELRQKREAEKREAREAERREAEKRKALEEAKERKEREKEREAKQAKAREEREAREAREARLAREEKEKDDAKVEAKEERKKDDFEEARADGDRRRKNEAREAEPKARQGRKQDKDEAKEMGEQPTQVKSLRQTLTPSQLRRQQRKRQREARRAAEAAAREEDESEEEPYEVKPKQPERRQTERSSERERPTERERQNERLNERSNEQPKTKESRPEAKAEAETEAARPKAEEGKRARGGSVSSVASWDSQARKEEDSETAEAPRAGSDLRKDAEAFPTPRSAAGSFDSRRTQELDQNIMQPVMGITTLMISQVPEQTDAESFRRQLDSWGFIGTYNFFYMPPDVSEGWGGRCVFINFIDQAMANMCMSAFQQCPGEGVATPYSVQGLENNIAHFSQFVGAGDMVNGPLIVPTPTPSAWALNGAQAMINSTQGKFSPQIRGQFHKTKMCAFHKKKKCTMGVACPFAHCKEELNAPPDLSKTKLCVNFFRRKCNDINCKFAHGHSELRATGSVYKTELCRAWASGTCKAGDTCRYAHGVKELRGAQMGMGYMGFPMEDDYMSMDGQMGCDVMGGLQGIWEDEAAAMQHYNGHNGYASYPAGSGENRGRSNPSSNFSSGQPQDGTADVNDAMSDMGLSDVSTLCPGEGRLSRQQTAPPTASFPADNGRAVHSNVVLRVKGTFMESVFLDEEVERMPLRRSWSDGDLPQLQDMEGEQEL